MENLFYNISQVLGITIIHSLWQGLLVWFALRLLLTCFPSISSVKKHNVSMVAMLTISVWFIYTFVNQLQVHSWVDLSAVKNESILPQLFAFPINGLARTAPATYYSYVIEGYLPYVSALYFAGLVFNLLRMGLNWQKISLIKRTMIPADQVQIYADKFCQKLRISQYVSVNFSRLVDVPCMIGYFKPIILLPISLITYLSAQEVEAILLHELSHIKRHDYLLNMVQQLATILLFFNPFAQLINHIINQERENRCDDLVVQTTAQPLIYAQALLKLEQSRQGAMQLALAATGKKYHLLNRIERIMKTKKPIGNIRHLLVAVAIMAASISSIAWLNPTIKNGRITVKKVTYPKAITALLTDTTAKKVIVKKVLIVKRNTKAKSGLHKPTTQVYDGFDDVELNKLTAEVSKHADVIGRYYDSPEINNQKKLMDEVKQATEDFQNNPRLKQMQLDQEKLGAEIEKNWGQTSEMQETSKQMGELGDKIGKYFNTPEFKQMNEQLEKKYGIPHNRNYVDDSKDENYKKYQAELQSKLPAEVKQQTDQLKRMGEQMRSNYDSPELRKKTDELRAMGDSMRSAYDNNEARQLQKKIKIIQERVHVYENNPQIKREQELLKQASKRLQEYTNSPAFKKRMADHRKQVEVALEDKTNSQDIQPVPIQ
ncbi:M56 family metallopeptidase [Mucilaginibacter sp. SP1R1]|uniref:M56 family metallopeptidase n=1 Tax=Mucilaginibacter sp. SP1R1 TaxID=2723091 RepID=UPI001614C102|nr:M56 family metallopeptidase [Mucilaginibacter sp. SP1R1]MBB6151223.1 beta-lactamase regulating signal transducer with metallopeptidase domain [Mucilaginibacter sp. SP1R1]